MSLIDEVARVLRMHLKTLIELVDRDINKRFEGINRRFEDLRYYIDRRVGFLEKLIVGLNVPILLGVAALPLRAFI
ncbi:MAG: hypothetical protein DRJ97_05990 [Thermoprotei archaeon]|nr:MAG: hypothetical protein DRJ97_05990 [Thermoprotei archaeon]